MEKTEKQICKKQFFKNRIKPLTVVLAVLCLLCSAFILWNASRTAVQSNAISNVVTNSIKDAIESEGQVPSVFEGTDAIREPSASTSSGSANVDVNVYYLGIFVRKSAHLLGYTLLSFLLTLTFISYGKKTDLSFTLGISLGIFNAIIDETIQNFTNGRTGRVRDVLLDTCGCVMGAFFAIALVIVILAFIEYRKNKKIADFPVDNSIA